MLGLDAAGKTTVLYKLKLGDNLTPLPTIGFNVESVEYHNLILTIWDVGGQDKIRTLWNHYFDGTQGLIYVVDSNDVDRLAEAREELYKLLDDPRLRDVKLLVYCNKQDLPNSISPSKMAEELALSRLRPDQWYIQPCCATSGTGLYEGLDWFAKALNQ